MTYWSKASADFLVVLVLLGSAPLIAASQLVAKKDHLDSISPQLKLTKKHDRYADIPCMFGYKGIDGKRKHG